MNQEGVQSTSRERSVSIIRTIRQFDEFGHAGSRPESDFKHPVMTTKRQELIREHVRRNLNVSMRKTARDTGIPRESVRQIVRVYLKLRPTNYKQVQILTDNKCVRLQRCREFLRHHALLDRERILFPVEQAHNYQNDRSWSVVAPGTSAFVERRQNPQSAMVLGEIRARSKALLFFVHQRMKIK